MIRREFLKLTGAWGLASLAGGHAAGLASSKPYDVLVVGAGVFGVWTAAHLHRAGKRVAVIEAVSPAHAGASSGGESRVTRCCYGDAELYTDWAWRSLREWRALSERAALPLFHELGLLLIHNPGEPFIEASTKVLAKSNIPFVLWPASELRARFPVLRVRDDEMGYFEPHSGGLMARRAVQQLARELASDGVDFIPGRVRPVATGAAVAGALASITTEQGAMIQAEQFVFACGPWLDKVCPEVMTGRLTVTRQEVIFFAANRTTTGALPVWADLPFYGLPDLEGRGFKVANDTRGPQVDIDRIDRRLSRDAEEQARAFLARRFPAIADSPINETRVCQYENSVNGDFVIDRHPGLENVWLAGCGSGHGFKHGPAVGAHVAGLVLGTEKPIPALGLA